MLAGKSPISSLSALPVDVPPCDFGVAPAADWVEEPDTTPAIKTRRQNSHDGIPLGIHKGDRPQLILTLASACFDSHLQASAPPPEDEAVQLHLAARRNDTIVKKY